LIEIQKSPPTPHLQGGGLLFVKEAARDAKVKVSWEKI